jgi:hypothetical protein
LCLSIWRNARIQSELAISSETLKMSVQVDNSTLKTSLQELLNSRDMVTAALSKADPASASQLQAMFAKTQATTKAQP